MKSKYPALLFLLFSFILSFPLKAKPKYPKREMRAVWVATVLNIDWPSQKDLSVEEQKKEIIDMLDLLKKDGMNTIVFQVRSGCDAVYVPGLEPWAEWLTGIQGKAPEPFYDPLSFIIDECHKRNMEFHAWFNPFRAVAGYKLRQVDSSHISVTNPEMIITYGENKILNPALPETRSYVSAVVADVVRRYDIDAVHMDDYFYPYKIKDKKFNDSLSFTIYNRGYMEKEIDDWRRDNVDMAIRQIHDSIKALKPWVQFGISPFGVWRNKNKDTKGSDTQAGQTCYDDLYADILKWMRNGWIDYVTPQIYWHIGHELADFKTLAKWWNTNSYGINTYIGHGIHRLNTESETEQWRNSNEVSKQVKLCRSLPHVSGSFYFSSKVFMKNPVDINQAMRTKIYPYPALIPENPAIHGNKPAAPAALRLNIRGDSLIWDHDPEPGTYYVLYRFRGKSLRGINDPANIYRITNNPECRISKEAVVNKKRYSYLVTAISRTHQESDPSNMLIIED